MTFSCLPENILEESISFKICETLHTSPNYLFEFSEDKDVQDVLELLYTLTPDQLKAVKHMISSYLEFKEKMEE